MVDPRATERNLMRAKRDDLRWRRSRSCDSGACLEVAITEQWVYVRDSKDPEGAKLQFTRAEWREFLTELAEARSGRS
jgi:Domain of unknown function (DUF397)